MPHLARALLAPALSIPAALLPTFRAPAQCPPGASMPTDVSLATTMPAEGPARTRLSAALTALTGGDREAARDHLLAALEFHPACADVLLELVDASRSDADALAQWLERYVRTALDERGRYKPDREAKRRLGKMPETKDLLEPCRETAEARAAAVLELARYATRLKPTGKQRAQRAILVRWASELLLEAGAHVPAPVAAVAADVREHQAAFEPDYDLVYDALTKCMQQLPPARGADEAPQTGTAAAEPDTIDDRRVRAARILAGLARQLAFEDLKGPRPDGPGKVADQARELLEDERRRDVAEQRIWTIAELEQMGEEEALRFTAEHRDWHHPALALSPNGRYRIETTCGYHTLLGTARTIELHHERLVSHYGVDPFETRQGIVRVVPENHGLETEGAPQWWAAGFQGGDRTTVRFAWGTISGLGRVLTHELTHRFDGTLRPFLPPWYVEGHADWTGAHYARMADREFVENWLNLGPLSNTWYRGYGNPAKFEKLLKGEVDDYRHNYFAGYSLYAFLRSYPPSAPRYRSALAKFEKNARGGQKDPVGYFTSVFCDGEEGRPAELEELVEDWREFTLAGYEWGTPERRAAHPWVEQYGDRGQGDADEDVMDEPTWSWARRRAEPFYGQDHAALAALLLDEVQDDEAAIAAGVWSLAVDGWRPDVAEVVLRALMRTGDDAAAAAFASMAHRRFESIGTRDGAPLLQALPKCRTLLDTVAARATALAAAGHRGAAQITAREHAALAARFALPPLECASPTAPTAQPRHLGASGFAESELLGYDERRRKGLWFVTDSGDLHVGRDKPRENTGVLDRRAHQRDAYAHSVEWLQPGHFVVRGRIHWTTSYVSGAIVLGHTRRDRGIRIRFSAGDYAYAIGRSERQGGGRVRLNLDGLWERDGKLRTNKTSETVEVPEHQNWFEFEIRVRGPRVEVWSGGEQRLVYSVHDATPIEGHVGFAVGQGAIRVQQPTVQRLDDELTSPFVGLDVAQQPDLPLEELMNLQTRGLPTYRDGTVVLWLPTVDEGETSSRLGRAIRPLSRILQQPLHYPQPWVVCLPHDTPQEERDAVVRDMRDLRPGEWPVVEHRVRAPFDSRYPWLLFLDGSGTLRAAADCRDVQIVTRFERWARRYRGR